MEMMDVLTQSPFLLEFFVTKVTTVEEPCLVMPGKAWGPLKPDATSLANVLYAGGRERRPHFSSGLAGKQSADSSLFT